MGQVIAFTLAKPLPLLNRMQRTDRWTRSRNRKALAWEVAALIPFGSRPSVPFDKAKVTVTRRSTGTPDPDNLLCKHLLDVLQPYSKRHPNGLGIIRSDANDCITLISKAERVVHKDDQGTDVLIEGEL
jgi:hypothetical protein